MDLVCKMESVTWNCFSLKVSLSVDGKTINLVRTKCFVSLSYGSRRFSSAFNDHPSLETKNHQQLNSEEL